MTLCLGRYVLTGSLHPILKYGNLKWKWFPPMSDTTDTINPNTISHGRFQRPMPGNTGRK